MHCFIPSVPVVAGPGPAFTSSAVPLSTTGFVPRRAHAAAASLLARRGVTMVQAPERRSDIDPSVLSTLGESMSILLPEKLSQEGIALLSADFNVEKKLDLTPDQLIAEIANYEAIIIRSGTKMTRDVIAAAPKLKVIGRAGVGVDNIDIPAATEQGVLVVNAPTGNCIAAAEHSIALLTGLARMIAPADARVKAGGWDRSKFVGASLVDKTLGVIGLGRIGREVAKRAKGLGMNVVASDPFTSQEAASALGVTLGSFDEVLAKADFLTLHIPLTPTTKHLVDAAAMGKMKQGARLINAARGGIVDEEALLKALEDGHLAGAGLDCFESEPPYKFPDSVSAKLVQHAKVLATPHLGASTREAQEDVAVEIATAVRDALKGDMVATMINAPAVAPNVLKLLKPRATLCTALGRLAYFVSGMNTGGEVRIDYHLAENAAAGEDTRMLRAGVIKGLMEPAMGIQVSIVNADSVAKNAGLNLVEVNHMRSSDDQSSSSEVKIAVKDAPVIEGRVTYGEAHVTRIGPYQVDMRLDGCILLFTQDDTPGQLGKIGTMLGDNNINISFMTLGRCESSAKALVLYGLDSCPNEDLLKQIDQFINDDEIKPVVIDF